MQIKRMDVWLANLNPQKGTEPGKVRPVLILQTDLLNDISHASTIICPFSTNLIDGLEFLRIRVKAEDVSLLEQDCDVLLDQIRAIDNARLFKKLGELPIEYVSKIALRLNTILDLDLDN
ncbi:type II toxin-antitoxin system PemK/MazF family toxin [Lacihabitans sp. LS3-19]|uniref:type II toxin-antitoxin system PemK/MazF family toxin n=1 Tax=Lacihabitans sp. LS3-19 TaxID=2487335 RepID=UPI0020CBEB1C|nr:type II toxin-antitoxin system PemK/MazF family toxin [Lacihabitans sp. LS3-19]MCP9769870.1 type II toxin-antitoxin system PemK/MazF family toxin [Lacihabitans sp. LS3-19]